MVYSIPVYNGLYPVGVYYNYSLTLAASMGIVQTSATDAPSAPDSILLIKIEVLLNCFCSVYAIWFYS